MFMTNLVNGKICLTLVVIQKIQSFLMRLIEKLLDKWKMNLAELVIEFVGLKSKMHSMKKIDVKECNTAKGVSIATEFDKFKNVWFNEKVIRHKIKRIQSKKHKLGTYEINKIPFSCFDNKRYVLDDGICTLAYFHKDSVTSCKEIQKDCDDWKKLWWLKKIVIIKKDCDKKDCNNWKRLWLKNLCL